MKEFLVKERKAEIQRDIRRERKTCVRIVKRKNKPELMLMNRQCQGIHFSFLGLNTY